MDSRKRLTVGNSFQTHYLNANIMEKEIWKDVSGYEGYYQVSNLGRVKSVKRKVKRKYYMVTVPDKIMKQSNSNGYKCVRISKNGNNRLVRVHRLVAFAFLYKSYMRTQVNHKNGIRNDNMVNNLEWCTASENIYHAYNKLIRNVPRPWLGKKSYEHNCSKTVIQYGLNGNIMYEFGSVHEAKRITGISNANICECCNGNRKTAGGFKWKYKNNNHA